MPLDAPLSPALTVERFLNEAPVDIFGMAGALGITLVAADFPPAVSGRIASDGAGGHTVTVNASHSETRRRFTVAHGVAHLILHEDLIGEGVEDDATYRSALPERIEIQASRYAASLLMPGRLVRQALMDGGMDAEALAEAFDVSPSVARLRAKEFGVSLSDAMPATVSPMGPR